MQTEALNFLIIPERPIVRNDQTTDIDVAIDIATATSIGAQPAGYALNLCLVIDRSGSMDGEKLDLAKKSCLDIYESLNPADRLTVLAFDDDVVSVVNPQTPATVIKERIHALQAGGQTDLSKGWYLALLELQTYATERHLNRLVLLSDGQANAGEQKASVLGAESARARNDLSITTSTIGIGKNFQEDILAALAHESGGRFWYIGEARIEDIIKEEFSGALSVILERPRIEVTVPAGVSIVQELNDLPKISGRYRLRPLKGNDRFCFALRLRVEPSEITDSNITIGAALYDGAGVVERTQVVLRLGSIEDYVSSAENPDVTMIVRKFLAATSDEEMVAEMSDPGNVTKVLSMLQSQSDLLKELETKLAGQKATSWETMTEREREERERELGRLRMEIAENESLEAVGELVDLMQGLGRADGALRLMSEGRKMHMHRGVRNQNWDARGDMDNWAARSLLEGAAEAARALLADHPQLREEITAIGRKLDEQLARFS